VQQPALRPPPSQRRTTQPGHAAGGPPTLRDEVGRLAAAGGPWLACAAIAAGGALVRLPFELVGLPAALLALVGLQAIGIAASREAGERWARRAWWMALACSVMLAPVLALQASVGRTPFVTFANGSAGPLLWLTICALALLGVMLGWTASVSTVDPSRAAVLWAPAALLVPAMLTTGGGDITGRDGLAALALAFGLAGLAAMAAEAAGRQARMPLVAAVFALELVALLVLGRGPDPSPGQGRVVPVTAVVLLLAAAGSIAAAPAAALVGRRFAETTAAPPPRSDERRGGTGPAAGSAVARRLSRRSAPPSDR
jgi:hypothetical protein